MRVILTFERNYGMLTLWAKSHSVIGRCKTLKIRHKMLLLLILLGAFVHTWVLATDTVALPAVLGVSRAADITAIECTGDTQFQAFRDGKLTLSRASEIAAVYDQIANIQAQRKLFSPLAAQTKGIRAVFTLKNGNTVEYREGVGFVTGNEQGKTVVYRELKRGDYQMDVLLRKLRDDALTEENKAFLNLFPTQKTFAQATGLNYVIDRIDSVKIASGNTGSYIILTDRGTIRALYDALRELPLSRALYEPDSGYGYALYFRENSRGLASFTQSAYGTLAQNINDRLAVVYRLEDPVAIAAFEKAVQPRFAAGLLRANDTTSTWARSDITRAGSANLIPDRLAGENMQAGIPRWKFAELLAQLIQVRAPHAEPKPIESCPYDGYTAEVTAWRYGLLEGRDGGFASNDILTRQECAVLLSRTLTLYGGSSTSRTYTDAAQAAPWAQRALTRCGAIFAGDTNGNFRPNDPMRVEEAIIAVARLYQQTK